jgi:ribosome-binding factor A
MTSVVAVVVAPDLKTAKVFISVLGDEASKESTLTGLKSAASFIRGQLAKTLNLRNTPELTFHIDNSIEYGVHMSKLIDEVNQKSRHHEAEQNAAEDDEDEDDEDSGDDDEYEDDEETGDDDYNDDGEYAGEDGNDLTKEEDE